MPLGSPAVREEIERQIIAFLANELGQAATWSLSPDENLLTGEYIDSIGWDAIVAWERELGQRFIDGLPKAYRVHGIQSMEHRTPTFALTHPSRAPEELADELARRDIAAWPGNYYALEIMKRLRLDDGCLRVGMVHYNTAEEVDRLLAGLAELV